MATIVRNRWTGTRGAIVSSELPDEWEEAKMFVERQCCFSRNPLAFYTPRIANHFVKWFEKEFPEDFRAMVELWLDTIN